MRVPIKCFNGDFGCSENESLCVFLYVIKKIGKDMAIYFAIFRWMDEGCVVSWPCLAGLK